MSVSCESPLDHRVCSKLSVCVITLLGKRGGCFKNFSLLIFMGNGADKAVPGPGGGKIFISLIRNVRQRMTLLSATQTN